MSNDVNDLEDLLEREREVLLSGHLQALEDLIPIKEALIERLSLADGLGDAEVTVLKAKSQRNQLLLDGAVEGIHAVSSRLENLHRVRASLETYDASGQKLGIDIIAKNGFEKRA